MKRLLLILSALCCMFPALGAIRFNPIVTNTPAGMTNVILDVAAAGTNSWSSNSVASIRATGANYSTNFVGQLSPTNYNNGTAANAATFLRGDGTWVNPSTGSATNAIGNLDGIGTNTVIYNGLTSLNSTTNKGDVYLEGTTTAGNGKIVVIDQVSKLAKTADGVGITNGSVWATAFEGDGSLVTGLTNGLATVPYVTAATNAMNGANWTFGNIAGNGLLLTNLRTNGTAADGVLPASGSNPFSGWFTDNNGVPLWREFYYITNSFPTTLFFNITGNAVTATTATNAMLLSSTGIGLADTNWVLSQVASLGSYMYFGGPTNTFAITNSGETVSRTNVFTGSTGPFSVASTSSVSGLTLNAYVRHVISTNRFNVIEAGPVSIVTYPFRSGGGGTVSGHYEFYVVDCVSNIMYELAAGPVTVISATVPTAIQTSLSLTNAFIATNQCYFAIAFKMDSIGSGGPQLHWAHGGAYDAHATFTRPLSSATINASQIVGVLSTNNIPTNYIQYGSGSGISISNNVASAPHIDLDTNGAAWFSSNVVLGAGSKYYGDGSSLSNLTGVAANAITNNNQGDVNLTNLNVYGILRGSDIRVDDLIVTNPPAFNASAMTNFPASISNAFPAIITNATFNPVTVTVATLPGSPVAGQRFWVSDVITSRGTGDFCFYDGTSWRTSEKVVATADIATFMLNAYTAGLSYHTAYGDFDYRSEIGPTLVSIGLAQTGANGGSTGNADRGGWLGSSTGTSAIGSEIGYSGAVRGIHTNYIFVGSAVRLNEVPTAAETYYAWTGLGGGFGAYPTAGAYFLCDPFTNRMNDGSLIASQKTNNWICVTATGSSYTYSDSGLPISNDAAGCRLLVSLEKTQCVFLTNGVPCATNSLNLPTNNATLYYEIGNIVKTNGSTARIFYVRSVGVGTRFETPMTLP